MPGDAGSRETALDRSDSALSYSHYETIDACDNNKRVQLIKEIEQHLMDDSCAIYFCYPLMNFVTKAEVTGVTSHTSDYYWVSKDTGFTD